MNGTAQEKIQALKGLWQEIYDLGKAAAVLHWDRHTQMPPGGHAARGQQLTTLSRLIHERMVSPRLGDLLEELKEVEEGFPRDSDEASLIRVARRKHQQAARVPVELVARMSQAGSRAHRAWLGAREANDFPAFVPALKEMVGVMSEVAQALGYQDHPMDALIDYREPDLTVGRLEPVFEDLKAHLVPLARAVSESGREVTAAPFLGDFDPGRQVDLGLAAVRTVGFDPDQRGRQDLSVHPFCTSFSSSDVRITTRARREDLRPCFFALIHEAGHGTYEQGMPEGLEGTPLHGGVSSGLHESQSRLWENVVGRSRPFWEYFAPIARAFFPAQLGGVSVEEMYWAANTVSPGYIRVEADEVTYNLHIMVRFEIEKQVLSGDLRVEDIPGAWNEKMEEYLGVTPPDDLKGALQDIHWTMGFGGMFQGYTLGNVIAAALYRAARAEHPDMESDWRRGDFSSLLSWMRENIHAHGSKFEPEELLERATGSGLTTGPYLEHLREKYGEIYGL